MRSSIALLVILSFAAKSFAQSTAFTYQGQLKNGVSLAEGQHDFRFRLFDAASGGSQLGATLCLDNISVKDGVFTATIDFGEQFITPNRRFIEIDVRHDTGLDCSNTTGYVTLTPRQEITPAPTSIRAASAFSLAASDGSPAQAVFVNEMGNVGIGTTAPLYNVHIANTAPILALQDTDATTDQFGYIAYVDSSNLERGRVGYGTAGPAFGIVNNRPGGDISLLTNSGRVGIGTTLPQFPLQISNNAPVLALQDNNSSGAIGGDQVGYLTYRDNTNVERAWVGFGAAGDPDFTILNARTNGDIVLTTLGGGRVGIGTASPTFTLDVAGSIRCTSLTETSSAIFKDDITPLAAGLDDLLKLEPVSYTWNEKAPDSARGKRDLGFIAEDVANVLPDAVARDGAGSPVGIDYSRITVLAVKAIKEQQACIREQQEQLRLLRARLSELEEAMKK